MFRINDNRGFQITFDNGWTVSVQIGDGNYHSNRDLSSNDFKTSIPTPNAEIAAWDKNDNWYEFDTDTVKGWVSPNEVLDFMNMIAAKD